MPLLIKINSKLPPPKSAIIPFLTGKYPYPLFNERINCRLGEKIHKTNNLSVNSISRALKALQRFSIIIKNMEVKHVIPVATAAVRNAKNNKEFILPAEKILSSKIRILTKNQEAELAALGLLSNFPVCLLYTSDAADEL